MRTARRDNLIVLAGHLASMATSNIRPAQVKVTQAPSRVHYAADIISVRSISKKDPMTVMGGLDLR